MILDIIELPFKGPVLPEYNASTPIVIHDHPNTTDDVYVMGYVTKTPIHAKWFRYKILESINGALYEHICITHSKLNLNILTSSKDALLYVISTKIQNNNDTQTFRYHKTLSYLMSTFDSYYTSTLASVHQVALRALSNMYQHNTIVNDMEVLLTEYITARHTLLCNITTASITDAIDVMDNVRNIYDTVNVMLNDIATSNVDIFDYLDMMLRMPHLPVQNGLCGMLISSSIHRNLCLADIIPLIQPSTYGTHKLFHSTHDIHPIDKCASVNAHLYEGDTQSVPVGLIEVLTNLELCGYSDISIEVPYTPANYPPSITIHYSGSIGNTYETVIGGTLREVNMHELFNIAVSLYGEDYDANTPSIHICKTYAEDVYIRFSSSRHADIVHYFDLTIMALLSPIILDDTAAQFVYRQMYT